MRVPNPLQAIRGAPERWKRRLRPAMVRAVDVVRALPGGRMVGPAMRRIAPGLHGWLGRRYHYYSDAGLGQPAPPPVPDMVASLGPRAGRVALWLMPAPGGRDG